MKVKMCIRDRMIVENRGMSISEIFDEFGEAYFRNLESNTLIAVSYTHLDVYKRQG